MANRTRAATTRLQPGQHSVDRAVPRDHPEGGFVLDWSVRLKDGRLLRRRTQGPTKGDVRARARAKADELLATGTDGAWKLTDDIAAYVDRVSRPAIEAAKLRPGSREHYLRTLRLAVDGCAEHRHVNSLKGLPIASAVRFRALENCLKEIARLHGSERARQARTVLSRYVLQELIRDQLIDANPLAGARIDLSSAKTEALPKRGGQALTRDEYNKVLDFLLNLDPAEGSTGPRRGRWTIEDQIAKRRNAIDLTLLQAATGLRVSEANQLTWDDVATADDGTMHVTVSEDVSKTHRARRVPILDPRVAKRVLTRRNAAPGDDSHVIGSPADPTTVWDRTNCRKMTTRLYLELADALDIELLRTARTHLWRATLNSLLLDTVPEVVRAAFFGHDVAINRAAYTDLADTSGMVEAARHLRVV